MKYKPILPQEEPKQKKCIYCNNKGYIDNHTGSARIDCLNCDTVQEPKQETLNVKQNTHFVDFNNPNADKISSASTTVKQERFKEAIDKLIKLNRQDSFYEGVKSDAARDYWFEQFKKK